jgi:ribosome biogenesis protein MAK21
MAKPNKKLQAARQRAAQHIQGADAIGKSKAKANGNDMKTAFDEPALEKLTSHIEQNLTSSTGNQQKRKKPPTVGDNDNSDIKQNRKRQRNASDRPSRPKKIDKGAKRHVNEKDILLAEIKSLGGDEKDLELVEGIDSDEDQAQSVKLQIDEKLKAELAKLSRELGFADHQPSEASEEEEEGEAYNSEGQDDEVEDGEEGFDGGEEGQSESESKRVTVDKKKLLAAQRAETQGHKEQPQTQAQRKKLGHLVGLLTPQLEAIV